MSSTRAFLGCLIVLAGCGGGAPPAPASSGSTEVVTDETSHEGEVDEDAAATPIAAPAAPVDLLSCALAPRAYELGEAGDGEPSAPVAVGGSIFVAFTRTSARGDAGSDLYVQRIGADGTLDAPVLVRSGVHFGRPVLVAFEGRAYVMAVQANGVSEALALDAGGSPIADASVTLGLVPQDAVLGPRGLVLTQWVTEGRAHRAVRRVAIASGGFTDVSFPAPSSLPGIREQLLASGTEVDAVLVRHGRGTRVGTIDANGATHESAELFRGAATTTEERWTEASLASAVDRFALVRGGPGIGDLEVYLAGSDAAFTTSAVAIPPPRESTRPPDALVRRYPRIAALGSGWAISYWDGTGPSLVRVDASGAVTGDAIEIRSGDERGGHTDAPMIATADALAISWNVTPPMMSHGFPEEEPRRPGPRLAVLRCAAE